MGNYFSWCPSRFYSWFTAFSYFHNDLPLNLDSIANFFAYDTSLFSLINNQKSCKDKLNGDLDRISAWAYQWKMSFNPDLTKQATEVYFSRKSDPSDIPSLFFNNIQVDSRDSQKHLGVILDKRLAFDHHLSEKIVKDNKGIGLIMRLRKRLSRDTLLTIYKAFLRPHLGYGDILYDNPGDISFIQKIVCVQYNVAPAITGCIRGTSRETLYCEFGLESLADRGICKRLCVFYNVINGTSPSYLLQRLPDHNPSSNALPSKPAVYQSAIRTKRFQNSFFSFCISKWNALDCHIRNLPTISSFKRALFKFFRPSPASIYKVNQSQGIVLLTRLRVGFSHLREDKFRHNSMGTLDSFCSCRTNSIEATEHYVLQCPP